MITVFISLLVIAVLLLAWLLEREYDRRVAAEKRAAAADRSAEHDREVAKDEERMTCRTMDTVEQYRREIDSLNRTMASDRTELATAREQLAAEKRKHEPRPARFKLEGAMPEEEIQRKLRGTKDSPIVKAIEAHIGKKIVTAADTATDEPREIAELPDRTIPAYTGDMRLHDSGKASGFAILLRELQDLTSEQEEEKKSAA